MSAVLSGNFILVVLGSDQVHAHVKVAVVRHRADKGEQDQSGGRQFLEPLPPSVKLILEGAQREVCGFCRRHLGVFLNVH